MSVWPPFYHFPWSQLFLQEDEEDEEEVMEKAETNVSQVPCPAPLHEIPLRSRPASQKWSKSRGSVGALAMKILATSLKSCSLALLYESWQAEAWSKF